MIITVAMAIALAATIIMAGIVNYYNYWNYDCRHHHYLITSTGAITFVLSVVFCWHCWCHYYTVCIHSVTITMTVIIALDNITSIAMRKYCYYD